MHRAAVDGRFDILCPQVLDNGLAARTREARAEMDEEQEPVHFVDVGPDIGRLDSLEGLHGLRVPMFDSLAPFEDFLDAVELGQTERRAEIAHRRAEGRRAADHDGTPLIGSMGAITA